MQLQRQIRIDTVQEVIDDFEAENPGKKARDHMTPEEFGRRMMEKIWPMTN